jgi:hypothetical protein
LRRTERDFLAFSVWTVVRRTFDATMTGRTFLNNASRTPKGVRFEGPPVGTDNFPMITTTKTSHNVLLDALATLMGPGKELRVGLT